MGWQQQQTGCQLPHYSMAGLISFLGKDGSVYLMGWTEATYYSPCFWLLILGIWSIHSADFIGTRCIPTLQGWLQWCLILFFYLHCRTNAKRWIVFQGFLGRYWMGLLLE